MKWNARFDQMQTENAELKIKISKQDEEIVYLKSRISNLESLTPTSKVPYYENELRDGAFVVDEPPLRALNPPSSCKEVADSNNLVPFNGTYLLKNNNKMQAVYCQFKSGNPGKKKY